MTTEKQSEDIAASAELDDLVKELDAILDAWFMSDAVPALEEARRAAPVTGARSRAA